MGPLGHVGEDEPLPAALQHILRAGGIQHDAAAPLPRLQEQVNLGVVAQGFVVAHADHRGGDGLPVDDAPLVKADLQAETLR